MQSSSDLAGDSTANGSNHTAATGEVQPPEQQLAHSPFRMQNISREETLATLTCSQLKAKIEKLWDLDFAKMFNSGIPGDNDMLERQAMLLYDPQEHPEEIELLTRWLLMHNVKVANLWYGGSWTQFREDVAERKSGVIIVCTNHVHCSCELTIVGTSRVRMLRQPPRIW